MRSFTPSGAEHSGPVALAASLLALLVTEYPAQFTLEELARSLTDDPEDWSARDDMEVALRQLVADGLVYRHGDFAFATRAAVRAEQGLVLREQMERAHDLPEACRRQTSRALAHGGCCRQASRSSRASR